MLLAARKLQGIGLVLFVLLIAMTLYPVSLRVAATRSELAKVESELLRTKLNIRYLETEFSARASMRQLERWNAESLGYAAPEADQFLSGERALASLDSLRPLGTGQADRMLLAVAVVPETRPAARSAADIILDASIPSAHAKEPALPPRKADAVKAKSGADEAAPPKAARTATAAASTTQPKRDDKARERRVASLDRQLLTPAALLAIDAAAGAEAGAGKTK
ncbi:MAG: hypothetical protein GW859_06605 [Sphingomonadales bacterium]|nr:hypothetical protein [Sphingomonadales bacterium]